MCIYIFLKDSLLFSGVDCKSTSSIVVVNPENCVGLFLDQIEQDLVLLFAVRRARKST